MKQRREPQNPGDVLRQARIDLGYNESVVIARLSITEDTFRAIESWDVDRLPDNAHLIPILRRHAEAVGVDYAQMSTGFPDALQNRLQPEVKRAISLRQPSVVLSSFAKLVAGISVVILVAGYVVWQSSSLGSRPRLVVLEPMSGIVTTESVLVRGEASQGSQVFVNGTSVLVNERGEFTAQVVLQLGANTIVLRAVNNVGAEREELIAVVRK